MRRAILLAGVLPFVSAFLGGVLALSVVVPSQATAQSSETQEVRASAFTLVGPDGTVLARLSRGRQGTGLLALYDATGTARLNLVGTGVMNIYDQDGTTPIFRAGRTFQAGPSGPLVNGVELGPGGSVGMIPPLP